MIILLLDAPPRIDGFLRNDCVLSTSYADFPNWIKIHPKNSYWLNFSQRSFIYWRDFSQSDTHSCSDHFRLQFFCWSKVSIFTSQYSSKLFFPIKKFSTTISFNRRTLGSFILFTTLFLLTTSPVFQFIRSWGGSFIPFYSPFRLEKDVQYCTRYTAQTEISH